MTHCKRVQTLGGILAIGVLAISGCATTGRAGAPEQPAADSAAAYEAERAAVAARPVVPGEGYMMPDMELYTYELRGGSVRRDTIAGAASAASWLRQVQRRTQGTRRPFELDTREVGICSGAAIERGVFAAPGADPRQPLAGVQRSYMALWRQAGDGWRMERLWLSPINSPSVGSLANDCVFPSLRPPRVGFGAAGGVVSAPTLDGLVQGMRDDNLEGVTTPDDPAAMYRVWALLRISEWAGLRFTFSGLPGRRLSGISETALTTREVDIDVGSSVFSLVGEVGLGPLWIGAGPALALVNMHYGHRYWGERASDRSMHVEENQRVLGMVGELTARFPLTAGLRAIGSYMYAYFPEVEPQTMAAPGPFTLPRNSMLLGLEWAPE